MAEAQNPFLLPPGPPPATAPPSTDSAPPDAPPARDPDHYIAIPASVESATHRLARPERSASEPDEPDEPATPAAPAAPAEETVLAVPSTAARAAAAWVLLLPDGARVEITGPTLLGRDPAPSPEHPGARLLPLEDPGKTMSKTHALLEPERGVGALVVHDLYSTNGIAVDAAGIREIVVPGSSAAAHAGSSIYLGSFLIRVAAGDPDHA
jgi:hypothetical protein